VIVTTCNCSFSSRLKQFDFKRVVIDEATQAKEAETLLTCLQANQLVLIGDQQ
jgi:superfamily I DNA and/or RNA helicase